MALFFIALSLAAGLLGGVWGNGAAARAWYDGLRRPPGMARGARLTALWVGVYVCLGLAGFELWNAQAPGPWSAAFQLYLAALALLVLWPAALYGLRRLALGWALGLLLWAAAFAAAFAAADFSWPAWALFLPPVLWLAWAARYNYYLWRFNPRPRNH